MSAKDELIAELRRHALIVGEVTLTSGATAQYYVDAKRAILRPAGFPALSELVATVSKKRLRVRDSYDARMRTALWRAPHERSGCLTRAHLRCVPTPVPVITHQ